MTEIIVIVLGLGVLLYVLLGGADFGAGIIELFTGKKGTDIVTKAIAPIWEANHVWLILVVVILFMGFPGVYSTITLTLHIPIMLVLVGIIFRGTAFAFRHYDIDSGSYKKIYTVFFRVSSIFTPFFLGVTLGAAILGRINFNYENGFYTVFMDPGLNIFCLSLGLFVTLLFSFLASVYLIGEADDENDRKIFVRISVRNYALLIGSGGFVFLAAEIDNFSLISMFLDSTISIICIVLASLLIPLFWWSINKHKKNLSRILAGLQTFFIVIGWFAVQYPVLIRTTGEDLSVYNTAAPDAVMVQLLIALVVGIMLILPAFFYLFRVFKKI
jgi:cytochrome d ubiquinol oxidase subunit II